MKKEDAIYARQSIDKADSISIESQIEFCKYETRGEPYRAFFDKGYSGKNTDRPQFQEMRAAIRAGEIKRVICYKLDRCSRSILDFAQFMEELQQFEVEFVSCTEKFDTSTPMGRAMLNICIVFAQLERETIQQRVYDAYHSRNVRGFFMGGKLPFGFKTEPYLIDGKKSARYLPIPEQVEILKLMYYKYEQPLASLGDVVNALLEEGIRNPSREDGRWVRTHIGRMLHNPAYVRADMSIYHFFKENGVVIHNDPSDFIGTNGCYLYAEKGKTHANYRLEGHHLVLAPHEGFIPSDVWLRCRKKHVLKGDLRQAQKAKNTWLAGKIKCAKCGYALVIRKATRKSGKEYRYIICTHSMETDSTCTGIHGLKAADLEAQVLSCMQQKLFMFQQLCAPNDTTIDPEISALRIKIAQYEQDIERYLEKILEVSGTMVKLLSDKASALEEEKQKALRRLHQLEQKQVSKSTEVQQISGYFDHWEELTQSDRLQVVETLIERIDVSESEMHITWRI